MLIGYSLKKLLSSGFVVLSIGLLIWAAGGSHHLHVVGSAHTAAVYRKTSAVHRNSGESGLQPPGSRFPDAEHFFLTDQGSLLPVFNWVAPPEEYEAFAQFSDRQFRQQYSLTVTSPPTSQSNCHGWVFLRGKFLIFAEQVEQILQENGYRTVAEPQAGDVIIYRNADDEILHSGLVWSVGPQGQILVHSKFGVSGRYLHSPREQPYGERFAYYRADRRRHAVRLRSAETAIQP